MKHESNIQPQDPHGYLRAGRRFQAEFYARLFRTVRRGIAALPLRVFRWSTGPIARRWRRELALDELSRLDNRTLKDIGLTRGEFNSVAEYYAVGDSYPRDAKVPLPERRKRS